MKQNTNTSAIREWWANNPMTYGSDHGATTYISTDGQKHRVEIGSKEFFLLADETFYKWNTHLHAGEKRFARIFDYEKYRGKKVLEVGCGMGCMASNWALNGTNITAVDLNPTAVDQTKKRFAIFGLKGDIRESNGEDLPFEDNSFNYVYSWGVLHHTPGIKKAIQEIRRVLNPGGSTGIMLYNRESLLYRYIVKYIEGFLHFEDNFLSPLQLASRYGDAAQQEGNPHTWPVTKKEVRRELLPQFENVKVQVFGTDLEYVLDNWLPGYGRRVMPRFMFNALARRWGWSLWMTGDKKG